MHRRQQHGSAIGGQAVPPPTVLQAPMGLPVPMVQHPPSPQLLEQLPSRQSQQMAQAVHRMGRRYAFALNVVFLRLVSSQGP